MIIRARTVLPMAGNPIENGAVIVDGNKITGVGRFDDVRREHTGDLLDLGEMVLLPGLINAHCHLEYTMLRGKIPAQESFTDWIRAINSHKAALGGVDYVESILAGLADAQAFGTTSIINLEAFPELIRHFRPPAIRVWWCAEMIDLRTAVDVETVADQLRRWFASHPDWLGGYGLAPHAPYTASPKLYAEAAKITGRETLPFTTHLAESRNETEMFGDASGALFDFLQSIGRPMDDCGGKTPVSRFLRTSGVDQRWIVAHMNEVDAADFDLLETAPKFHIAHCPRSHSFFRHAPFQLERLRALGFNICLGTDSLASNADLNLFAEMRELLRKNPSVSPKETLEMATRNGASALGQLDALGCLAPGAFADMIAFPIPAAGDTYENIVAFSGNVPWMMVDGEIKETAA